MACSPFVRPNSGNPVSSQLRIQHASLLRTMHSSARGSVRHPVRRPFSSRSEAEEAFDGITYDKGAAVLRMIEAWLGPDVFRRGVQRYVSQNAWKTATARDLFEALAERKLRFAVDGLKEREERPLVAPAAPMAPLRVVRAGGRSA